MRLMRFAVASAALALAPVLAPATASAAVLNVIHSFSGNPDGGFPVRPLTIHGGKIYGTTCQGDGGTNHGGTAFRMKADGSQYLKLHDFDNNAEGNCPSELNFHGASIYGTTEDGGGGNGTLFQMAQTTPFGVTVLHVFPNPFPSDGTDPLAGVVFDNNTLYGTTVAGGSFQDGTVYNYNGTETPIHPFTGTSDGSAPDRSLTYAQGALFGTARDGGGNGVGTLYKMLPSGTIILQYHFSGGANGDTPSSPLLKIGHYLYGTTRKGGTNPCNCGMVFKVNINAGNLAPVLVYSFAGGTDGDSPSGALAAHGGFLYGTTENGGSGSGGVYGIDLTSQAETGFTPINGATDGSHPRSGLVYHQGWFYGTASQGPGTGCVNGVGCGTVFKFQP